jgi:PKD repeat protein
MIMKTLLKYSSLILILAIFLGGCDKNDESTTTEQEAYFSYQADMYTVTFTNLSKLTGTYMWDFGDGKSSTEENPVHAYPGKGKYVVTLYVTSGGTKAEASTVLLLDKTSPVKLDDGTVSDWDLITKNVVVSGPNSGGVRLGKFDYDANFIYFYIEQESTIDDSTIVSIFIDIDTTLATGFQLGAFPGLGAEDYCEGQLAMPDYWFDPYTYNGDGSSWDWNYVQVNDFYMDGFYEESGSRLKYEFGLYRNKVDGLTNEAVRFALIIMDKTWSDFGYMPDTDTNGFLLMMNE